MNQHTGSRQPTGALDPALDDPALDRGDQPPVPRALIRFRFDRAAFALFVGLAGVLAISAFADLNGPEVAESDALRFEPAPDPSPDTQSTAVTNARPESERVHFDSERTALLATPALAQLPYDWESLLPQWRLEFIEGNDRVAGYTWSQEQRIEVFVRSDATSNDVARILAHELGHAVDLTHNTAEERQAWLDQRGADDATPWWPSSGAADFETGAGDFAECFTVWLIGDDDYRSVVGPAPSAADLELIAQLAS